MSIVSEYMIENTKIKIDDEYVRDDPEITLRQIVLDTKPMLARQPKESRQSKEVQILQENPAYYR